MEKLDIAVKEEVKKVIEELNEEDYFSLDVFEKADSQGMKCVLPKENELFIDIDTELDFNLFQVHFAIMNERMQSEMKYTATPSSSGLPHRHIIVTVDFKIDAVARIGLQAALGSDRKRELLSFCEHYNGSENTVTFFEPLEQV